MMVLDHSIALAPCVPRCVDLRGAGGMLRHMEASIGMQCPSQHPPLAYCASSEQGAR